LEPFDAKRLREFLDRVAVLSPADIGSRVTEKALYRETPIEDIVRKLYTGRNALIQKFEQLTNEDLVIAAIHPRLQKPMRLLDWAYFVAEHDDHHLAHARYVIRKQVA
jgi:hypothetical protein